MMKNKKIFFVTVQIPGNIGGGEVRNYNLIKNLAKKGYEIELFSIINEKEIKKLEDLKKNLNIKINFVIEKKLDILSKLFYLIIKREIPYLTKGEKSGISLLLMEKIEKDPPNIIQFETLNSYFSCRKIINKIIDKKIKIILDEHNVENELFKSLIRIFPLIKRSAGRYLLSKLRKFEINALKNSNIVLSCSDKDKNKFSRYIPKEKIYVIPNGVDINYFKTNKVLEENSAMFMGGFDYPPNDDALKFYFNNIHDIITNNFNNFRIYIVGKNTPKWIKKLSKTDRGIIVTGFVDDVRKYIKNSRVCICPLRYGSGTRLKILEYLSSSKPVVSTTIGAEGIDVKDGENIILVDNPKEFAESVIKILKNTKLAKRLGDNGRRLVEEKYSWDKIVEQTEKVYEEVLKEHNKKQKK